MCKKVKRNQDGLKLTRTYRLVAYAENVILWVYITFINMLQNKSNIPYPLHRMHTHMALSLAREISQEPTNLSVEHFFFGAFDIKSKTPPSIFVTVCQHVTAQLTLNGILQSNYTGIFPLIYVVIWMLTRIGKLHVVSFFLNFFHFVNISSSFRHIFMKFHCNHSTAVSKEMWLQMRFFTE